jgi:bacteriocin biosynthesis cyclodehydratase domain-containing protein
VASTTRVTPPGRLRVGLVGLGGFGQRVTSLLAADDPDWRRFGPDDLQVAIASSGVLILACWRPAPALCEIADQLAFRYGRDWLPVILDDAVIRVGPLIRPPSGPCFQCFRRRALQHDENRAVTIRVHQAYDSDPDCGPDGYLPSHARVAAGVVRSFVAGNPGARLSQPSTVVSVSLTRAAAIQRNAVLPWHDCLRCCPHGAGLRDTVQSVIRQAMVAGCKPDRTPASGRAS